MTDEIRGSGAPLGPPWSVDVLADLHAGVLDPALAAELWPQVRNDVEARQILALLDSVTADLGSIAHEPVAPMPQQYAARLDAAIAAEASRAFSGSVAVAPPPQHASAPVVDIAEARTRRNRRNAWGAGLLTAAAAAVAVTVAVIPGKEAGTPGGMAAPPTQTAPGASDQAPLAVTRDGIGEATGKVGNSKEYGPLRDQAGLDKCIESNGLDPAKAQTMGVRPVTLDGRPGIMALLTTGTVGQIRVLVVQPDCTAMFNDTVGKR